MLEEFLHGRGEITQARRQGGQAGTQGDRKPMAKTFNWGEARERTAIARLVMISVTRTGRARSNPPEKRTEPRDARFFQLSDDRTLPTGMAEKLWARVAT